MARQLVFVGGGHAHLCALANVRDYIKRGHRATLISPSGYHYYSGMGPGMLSGIYEPREIRFNIRKMIEDRGGRFVEGRVVRIDAENRRLILDGGRVVPYDVVSFNTGSEVPTEALAAPDEWVFPVKPIVNLDRARKLILNRAHSGTLNVVVAGGGPAGVEIAANAWKLLHDAGMSTQVTLVAGDRLLPGVASRARRFAVDSLAAKGIRVIEATRVRFFESKCARLTDHRTIPCDFAFVAVGVKPSTLFRDSGLPVGTDGGLSVNKYLQGIAGPELFGGGDCIAIEGHEPARVGVYAVRQGAVLRHNLGVALDGGEMKPFVAQSSYMLILNMGDGKGILWKKDFAWNGRSSFLLKDFIDRRFMKRFQLSGELSDRSNAL